MQALPTTDSAESSSSPEPVGPETPHGLRGSALLTLPMGYFFKWRDFRSWCRANIQLPPSNVRCAGAEGRLLACQRFALTDLHLLSKCRHLYVSKWSSYSEIAARLADLNSITGAVEQGCFTEEEMPDVMARAVAEAVQ